MTIQTHAPAGQDALNRRELIAKLVEITGTPSSYLGMPSCAYQVGCYRVERDGSIAVENAADLEALRPTLVSLGYIDPEPESANVELDTALSAPDAQANEPGEIQEPEATEESSTEPEPTEIAPETTEAAPSPEQHTIQEPAGEITQLDLSMPHAGMDTNQLRNFVFTFYAKQHLLNKALGSDLLFIHDNVVSRLQEALPEDIEGFVTMLEDFKALGELTGLAVDAENVTVSFPFNGQPTDDLALFPELLSKVIKVCKETRHVRPNIQRLGENEKYLMHSWLIRLGCGGPDFKALRSRLTGGLTGYCAFPDQSRADKHKAKYAEIRRNRREAGKVVTPDAD